MSMSESLYKLYLASIKDEDNISECMHEMLVGMDIRDIAAAKHNIATVAYVIRIAISKHLVDVGFGRNISDNEIILKLEYKWETNGCIVTVDDEFSHSFSEFQRRGDLVLFRLMNNGACLLLDASKEVK